MLLGVISTSVTGLHENYASASALHQFYAITKALNQAFLQPHIYKRPLFVMTWLPVVLFINTYVEIKAKMMRSLIWFLLFCGSFVINM